MHARVCTELAPPGRTPVVVVHGMVVSSLFMAPLAERLAPDFPVYTPDLPGFGDSEGPRYVLDVRQLADALADWMENMGLERAALVGNSLGCQMIADLAVRYPERVESAVLNGPTIDPENRTAVRQISRLMLDGLREKTSLALVHLRDYAKAGPRRAFRTYQHMMEDRIEDKLPRMRMPTMIVRGGRDPVVPQRWAEEATALLPDGRLRVIPGSAHATNWDAPLEFARVIRPFLLEISRTAAAAKATVSSNRQNR
jgi:2-hydroxy-6-oxonona-2,4-dienedioate hydrolase